MRTPKLTIPPAGLYPLPLSRSYWIRFGRLLGGCYPGDKDGQVAEGKLRALLDAGVNCFVNLMEANETDHNGGLFASYEPALQSLARYRGANVLCRRYPIVDCSVPAIRQMQEILNFIDEQLNQDAVVYLHCWGGRGRTGTVAGCHLMRHGEVSSGEVLTLLGNRTDHQRQLFGQIPETLVQRSFVTNWGRHQ